MAKYAPKTKVELQELIKNESINLGDIDVSGITDMSNLFYEDEDLNLIPLKNSIPENSSALELMSKIQLLIFSHYIPHSSIDFFKMGVQYKVHKLFTLPTPYFIIYPLN